MIGIASLHYPSTIFMSYNKARKKPRYQIVQSSLNYVPISCSKARRRKNHLRPKILRTLTKPYPALVPPSTLDDPVTPVEVEVNPEVSLLSGVESSGDGGGEELEVLVDGSEAYSSEIQVVEASKDRNVAGVKGVSSGLVLRMVASAVGFFVVVSAWMKGSVLFPDEEDREGLTERVEEREYVAGSLSLEMEVKIAEIMRMARKVREIEKRNKIGSHELDAGGVNSKRRGSGVTKEVDVALNMLRNVNRLNRGRDFAKEGSQFTTMRDTPKGFERGEGGGVDSSSLSNENREVNGVGSSSLESSKIGSEQCEQKSGSQTSQSLQTSKSSTTTKAFEKSHGSLTSGSDTAEKMIDEDAKPERGVLQGNGDHTGDSTKVEDSRTIGNHRKLNEQSASTSKIPAMSHAEVQPKASQLGKLPMSSNKKQNGDGDTWWSTLPYVLVILMQNGLDSDSQQGFYTLSKFDNASNQSKTSYIIAFEDRGDAKNFSYILEFAFNDLHDVLIDVLPLSVKELKQVAGSSSDKVIVVKKGELKLYAGLPLTDVESTLKSLAPESS